MIRTITLSLLLLITIGVMLPFTSSTAHGIRQSYVSRHHRRYHSRAWWRRHRSRMKKRRETALAHKNVPLMPIVSQPLTAVAASSPVLPQLPSQWKSLNANSRELTFRNGANSTVPVQAALSVVALSRPNPDYLSPREQRQRLAGVAISDLRRIVIDRMIATGGWVINDYERELAGARVFVVTAQTPGDSRSSEKSWNFYFTEINGRIYSLTTNTPLQFSDRMAGEAEKFITSLRAGSNSSAAKADR